MWLRRHKNQEAAETRQDQLARRIAETIISIQRKVASFLSNLINYMPIGKLKMLLILFCLLGSGLSIYLVTGAFKKRGAGKDAVSIERLQKPEHAGKGGDERIQKQAFINKVEYDRLQSFKKYIDSLKQDRKERMVYDSILHVRPFLPDSINLLETIYQSQHKH